MPRGAGLDAGPLGAWLARTAEVLAGRQEADVDCDGCTACCRSSQFVHVEPGETAALAAVPVGLRFAAPGLPRGHVVVPYDDQGRCPLLGDDGCSVYASRPRTCRTYDCRVYVAAGVLPDAAAQPAVAERAARWDFTVADDADRVAAAALAAARAEVLARPGADAVPAVARALAVVRRAVELTAD